MHRTTYHPPHRQPLAVLITGILLAATGLTLTITTPSAHTPTPSADTPTHITAHR